LIQDVFEIGAEGAGVLCPVLAYYGAGRAWLPFRARVEKGTPSGPARRWDAFYDCFEERIRIGDLVQWFQRGAIAAGSRKGRWRPGFDAMRLAILRCVPEADVLWFDGDRSDIVLSMPFSPASRAPWTNPARCWLSTPTSPSRISRRMCSAFASRGRAGAQRSLPGQ
jgi:hypothetical protein